MKSICAPVVGILLAVLTLGFASVVSAQTGLPPFSSVESGGFDAINHRGVNAMFSIPVIYKSGRGVPVQFAINYNSAIWAPVTNASTTWSPQPGFGWRYPTPTGSVAWTASFDTDCGVGSREDFYTNYVYTDPNGTTHPFNLFIITTSTCAGGARTGYATDASGFWIDATVTTAPIVYGPDGTKRVSPTPALYDPNGNSITMSSPGAGELDYTDTTGQIALKSIPGTGFTDFKYPDTNGVSQTFHLITQNFNIKTAFACPNIGEYTSTSSVALPTELDLPNGTKYLFTYEATPGASGFVTGRLLRVTLPTGGYYEYTYPGANDGNECVSGTSNLTRKINDGTTTNTWTFSYTKLSATSWKTTVTPPILPYDTVANVATYFFNQNGQKVSENFYSGAESPSNLLRTLNTTWATNNTPASQTTILENNQQSQVQTDYDSNGNLLETREYDWGSGAPGSLVRRTTLTYAVIGHILNRIASTVIKDGSGIIKSRKVFAYDAGGAFTGANCITGAPSHDDANYGCSFTARGNQTSATSYTDPVTPSGAITKNVTYDSLGNVRTAQVDSCQLKQWTFSSSPYAYPNSAICGSAGVQLTTNYVYDINTGLVLTSTDENGGQASYSYDSMKRIVTATRPDMAQIVYTYNDVSNAVTRTFPLTASASTKNVSFVDGLGRLIKQQTTDVSGTSYSIKETKYDFAGRTYKTSNPHNSTAQYWTEIRFDGLGRQKSAVLQDNSQTLYSYSGTTVTVTDPAGKQRKMQYDALGRLVSVFEPDVNSGNALTQQTSYTYNIFDAVTQVTQGVQTRTYTYDALGRLTDSTTPEAGHFNYQYNNFGLVTQRTDARGVITTYGYDTLNRPTGPSYNVGLTGVPATHSVVLTYGTNAVQFNNGRLITMTDGVGSENYAYNNLGQLTQLQKIIAGTTYTTSYAYNLAGEVTQITYPSNRVLQRSFDAIGRLCEIAPSTSGCSTAASPYGTAFGYTSASQVTGFIYGNGVTSSYSYSTDRLQLSSLSYHNSGCTSLFLLNYGYAQNGGNNGQITSVANPGQPGQSVNYTYDALSRLSSAASVGSSGYAQWGLSFTYDRYGNRTDESQTVGNPAASHVTFDQTKNRINTSGYAYDANGNMINDGNNTLVYDAENRAVSATNGGASGTYTYDGNGLRVEKVSGSTTTIYLFSGSKVIAEYDNGAAVGSPSREYVHSGDVLLAIIDAAGTRYHHPDQVSARLTTDSTQNSSAHLGQYPFGEIWYDDGTTTTKTKFATYERDAESGNDYAMARSYVNRVSRFVTPDPLGGDLTGPQSLNRYVYSRNDPINLTDPLGLFVAPQIYAMMQEQAVSMFGSLNGPSAHDFFTTGAGQPGCRLDGLDVSCSQLRGAIEMNATNVKAEFQISATTWQVYLSGGSIESYANTPASFTTYFDGEWVTVDLGMAGGPGTLPPGSNPLLQALKQKTFPLKPDTPAPPFRVVNRPEPTIKWINEGAKTVLDLIADIFGRMVRVVPFFVNPSPCGGLPSMSPSPLSNGGCS